MQDYKSPSKNFTRVSNDLAEKVPLNMIGILYYFLSKPPGWHMRVDDLLEHWTASENSLRKYLRELKEMGFIEIKPYYDTKKKRFAGSYYRLIESSGEGQEEKKTKSLSKKLSEQTYPKSTASAKAESLQNDCLNNNIDVINNNTDIKYIESNTIKNDSNEIINGNRTYADEIKYRGKRHIKQLFNINFH